MAISEITANILFNDYPLNLAANSTTDLPKPLISGESELNQTTFELITYPGPNPIFLNKLV